MTYLTFLLTKRGIVHALIAKSIINRMNGESRMIEKVECRTLDFGIASESLRTSGNMQIDQQNQNVSHGVKFLVLIRTWQ
jgi:hypothetical protein